MPSNSKYCKRQDVRKRIGVQLGLSTSWAPKLTAFSEGTDEEDGGALKALSWLLWRQPKPWSTSQWIINTTTFLMVPGRDLRRNTGSRLPGNSGDDCNINNIAKGGFHISDMAGLIWKVGNGFICTKSVPEEAYGRTLKAPSRVS